MFRFATALAVLLMSAVSSYAATTITLDADLEEFDLFGIDNPLPAVPLSAQFVVTFEETAPITNELEPVPGVLNGGYVYADAIQSFTVRLFDEFDNLLAEAAGGDTFAVVRNDFFDTEDQLIFRAESLSGLAPFNRMSLRFIGPTETFDAYELPLFTPDLLAEFPSVVAEVSGFPESDLIRLSYVSKDNGLTADVGAAPAPIPLPTPFVLLASAGLPILLTRKRRPSDVMRDTP